MYYDEEDVQEVPVVEIDSTPLPAPPASVQQSDNSPIARKEQQQLPIIINTGGGGGGGSTGTTMLWILAAIVVALLLFATTPSILDFLKDTINNLLGGNTNQGNGMTSTGVDPGNPGTEELPEGEAIHYTIGKTGFQNFNQAYAICAANADPENAENFDVKLDSKGSWIEQHDCFYYEPDGTLAIATATLDFQKFATKSDESWKSWILQFVTMGAWSAAMWTLPLQTIIIIQIQGAATRLGNSEMLWMGDAAQAGQNKMRQLLRDCPVISSGTLEFGRMTANVTATINQVYQRADTKGWKKTSFTNTKFLKHGNKQSLYANILHRVSLSDPWDTIPTGQIYADGVVDGGVCRGIAVQILSRINQAYLNIQDLWIADGGDPDMRPYSIPGAMCPSQIVPKPHGRSDQKIWEYIKAAGLPQIWLWMVINEYFYTIENPQNQPNITDWDLPSNHSALTVPRFYLCNYHEQNMMFLANPKEPLKHGSARAVLCWLAYFIYEPLVACFGESFFDRALVKEVWGTNMWVGSTPTTLGVSQTGIDAVWAQVDPTTLEDTEIDANLLANYMLPDTSTHFKKGCPTSFRSLL